MKDRLVAKIRWGGWILIALAVLILVWAADLAVHGLRLVRTAQTAETQLANGMENLSLAEASGWAKSAAGDLHAVRRDLTPTFPLMRLLAGLPNMDPVVGQVEPLLLYADGLGQAGKAALQMVEPVLASSGEDSISRQLLESLLSHPDAVQQVVAGVEKAGDARQRIRSDALPERFRSAYQKLDAKFPLMEQAAHILPLLPEWMGASQPRTYLLLAQNRDELRATGGFISGIGTVQVYQGQITAFDLGDSYRVDDFTQKYPPPPAPIQKYMLAGYWVTRDANWSPDFPTAARQTQSLYQLSTNAATDGVIAFDQSMVRRMLEAVGPLQISGTNEPVTAAAVENYIQQAWAPSPDEGLSQEWWLQRKAFMGELGQALLKRIFSLRDPAALMALANQLEAGIREGHLLVYLNSPASEAALTQMGWDGAVRPGMGDFLMLVDSNIGFNKTDAVVKRQVVYSVDLSQPDVPRAELRLRYHHPVQQDVPCKHEATYGTGTYANMMVRCYWNYWRILVMDGAQLDSAQSEPVPAEWLLNQQAWDGTVSMQPNGLGTQEIAGLMVLPTRADRETRLNLLLPERVIVPTPEGGWRYILRVQKQAGVESLPLTLQIKFPSGCKIPGVGSEQWSWQGDLTEAKTLDVQCVP